MTSQRAGEVALAGLQELPRGLETAPEFAAVAQALCAGRAATIDGAWNSSAALAVAALGSPAETPEARKLASGLGGAKTILIVLAHPRDLDFWSGDLLSFTGQRPVVFPAWDNLPTRDTVLDEVAGQRLRILKQLEGDSPPRYILTALQAVMQPVPDRKELERQRCRLRVGESLDLEELAEWLVEHGFQRREAVELPGEFSRRGGILDVFSHDADAPYRLELLGDEIESIRQFASDTQRSLGDLKSIEITAVQSRDREGAVGAAVPLPHGRGSEIRGRFLPPPPDHFTGHLTDYLPAESCTVLVEPGDLEEQGKHYLERVADIRGLFTVQGTIAQLTRFPSVRLSALPSDSMEASCHLRAESVERFSGAVAKVRDELDSVAAGDLVLIACHNEAEKHRLGEVLAAGQLGQSGRLHLVIGQVHAGFRLILSERETPSSTTHHSPLTTHQAVVVVGDHELFHREQARTVQPRRQLESRAIDSFLELQEGDLVVHVSHGIARYRGMEVLDKYGHTEEHLILEFREGTRVFVPASKIELVQKYVGGAKTDPELSKLGGTSWQRRKERVAEAVLDLASEMIELQALREARPGVAYPPDNDWQREFEASFAFEETPDQLTSMSEIKRDLERPRPMDRLICGDVGYGKTELAMRAAFKTVDNGSQVAVLVPTTVLAEQHYRTFSERLAAYPFVVECISRFRTAGEQKRIIERLAGGGVDIIIGTHRLVSADVKFKDLGLVIIDEEQRFGVEHKERLKRLRQTVDVLTMTATPIPRTLHLSLLGIRDISNLETPPQGRLAIETRIVRFDKTLIRHAILRELNRDGQVYFVHNRVYNIQEIANRLREIVPEARIAIAHGQMNEHELEAAMLKFVRDEADILVATTIIESGLDIPNVNTIFINQADNYGLADLHQLRGRVGRYKHRAYAYLLLDADQAITPQAARRLKAIEEFTELGAGFKIALRDLEIRGAGNILGTQQSGHIAAVGYEMYCQLLDDSVRRLKQQPIRTPLDVTIELPWEAYLPRDYVPGQRLKIEVYRRLSRIRRLERLEDFRQELRDRFGPPPEPVQWLLRIAELRLLAARWHVETIRLEGKNIADFAWRAERRKPPGDFPNAELKKTDLPKPGRDGKAGKGVSGGSGPVDLVLGYRTPRRMDRLAKRSGGRLRVVDAASAYYRLQTRELKPLALYECLKELLRLSERSR